MKPVIIRILMKKLIWVLFPICLLIISACGNQTVPTESGTIAATISSDDPCASENLPTTVQAINDLMREFDDTSQLASNLTAQQLPDVISDLQRIRREAEDLQIPPCLRILRTHQLNHMNLMIQTLIAFVGGANQQDLNNGLELAQQERDLYALEMVQLLGVSLVPVTATPP